MTEEDSAEFRLVSSPPQAHLGMPGWHREPGESFFRVDCCACGMRSQWKAWSVVDDIATCMGHLDSRDGTCNGCGVKPKHLFLVGASAFEKKSPLDSLFISPEEASKRTCQTLGEVPVTVTPELPLTEAVHRIEQAMEALSRRGLNLRAVVALIHDSNPSIPKKSIKRILESLRELPALYGKEGKK